MADDVLLNKAASIERCLNRIDGTTSEGYRGHEGSSLDPADNSEICNHHFVIRSQEKRLAIRKNLALGN